MAGSISASIKYVRVLPNMVTERLRIESSFCIVGVLFCAMGYRNDGGYLTVETILAAVKYVSPRRGILFRHKDSSAAGSSLTHCQIVMVVEDEQIFAEEELFVAYRRENIFLLPHSAWLGIV